MTNSGYAMQIVAHEDDDLFFINPDVAASIKAGIPTVTVYATAGNLSGDGATDGERAYNRQLGIKAAYARMAGISNPTWSGSVLWAGCRQVERYVLDGTVAPVEVVFVNLPDQGMDPIVNQGQTKTTIIVTNGLVTTPYSYARADVVNTLDGLMAYYQPTLVRYQDSLYDWRYSAEHVDHVATATVAAQAVAGYSPMLFAVPQRCYNIHDAPVNLPPADRDEKMAVAQEYLAHDSTASTSGWTDRAYQRWPRGASWIGRNADGRLQVFAVYSGALWSWWQLTGGGWSAARNMGAPGPLAPTVTACQNADGRLQVFARRLDTHTIVSRWQTAPNGSWSAWYDHGSPNAGDSYASQLGAPFAALSKDGLIWLFMKNGGGGVSARAQTSQNGPFGSWLDLGGSDVQEGVSAVCNPDGCWEVIASTRTGILHWYQSAPNGPFTLNSAFPATVPGSPPATVLCRDGSGAVAYRAADTAETTVTIQHAPTSWWDQPLIATGRPGADPVTLVAPAATGHQPILVARGTDGHVSIGLPNGSGWTWTDLAGGPFIDTPAATVDPAGTVTLVGVGFDGRVQVCTQTATGLNASFTAWAALPLT